MSPLRRALVALLVAATTLFAIGVAVERSSTDTHAEPASAERTSEDAHAEGDEAAEDVEPGEAAEQAEGGEELLGVDIESTPLVVLAVVAGLALAALSASGLGRRRSFLLAVTVIALAWAVLDVREVVHQLDESRTGVALLALAVAALHAAAAAVSWQLSRRTSMVAP